MPTFWTIQHFDKWKEFEEKGVLLANTNYVDSHSLFAYNWMVKQMRLRIAPSIPIETEYPIWAWYKYDDGKFRPDLRRAGYLPRGTKGVLIEFEEDFKNVVLSDFMDWHIVLNSDKELKSFDSVIINPSQLRKIAKSLVQATVWSIKIENVTSIVHFISK